MNNQRKFDSVYQEARKKLKHLPISALNEIIKYHGKVQLAMDIDEELRGVMNGISNSQNEYLPGFSSPEYKAARSLRKEKILV